MSKTPTETQSEADLITVCDKCLQASCWQAIFMCEESRDAGVTKKTRAELARLDREDAIYWKTDAELAFRPVTTEEGK